MNLTSKTLRLVLACTVLFSCWPATGQVAVHHTEGLVHGFLVLRSLEGETLAHGDLAPLLGKQPPDIHAWILRGEAPAFVKSRGPLYPGGPIWQIELESPVWPDQADRH